MYRVLIVDDEPKILHGLSKLIHWEDYGIEIAGLATNGAEALKVIEGTRISILITDINMPQMNGLELIQQLKSKHAYIKSIILSGYNDFTYVKAAIKLGVENYLLKPVIRDELSSTLINIIKEIESEMNLQIQLRSDSFIIKNNILNRWLTNNISPENLVERAELLNIELNSRSYLVCLIKVLYEDHQDNSYKNIINFACENICNEILNASYKVTTLCDLNGYIVALFHGTNDCFEHLEILKLLEKFRSTINQLLKHPIFATIGSDATGSQHVHKSYANASQLMSYSQIMPSNSIADYNTITKSAEDRVENMQLSFDNLEKGLLLKSKVKAVEFIEDTFQKLSRMKGITPAFVQNTSMEILYYIINTLNAYKIKTSLLLDQNDNIILHLLQVKSQAELCGWLKTIVARAIEMISSYDENINPIIKRILTYIETNYADNISLKTIAASMNVNAAYLGQLFIKEKCDTFSNYLNTKRIEKAMEYLRTSSLEISEIAEKVGYVNQSYFNNLFKKITGIYPTKYRMNSKNNENDFT